MNNPTSPAVPPRHEAALVRAARRISRLSKSCDAGFFFLTDAHMPSNAGVSGALLARLVRETPLDTVFFGGDIPEAFGDRASIEESVARYRSLLVEPVERAGGRFFAAHGNHDLTIRSAPSAQDGFTFPAEETRAAMLDTAAFRAGAQASGAPAGVCCYWTDDPAARIRYVVADTSDRTTGARPWWGVENGIGDEQLRWLSERALGTLPAGWSVLVLQHCPAGGVAANADDRRLYAGWRGELERFQAGASPAAGANGGGAGGGGAAAQRLLLVLSGHHHAELQSVERGVWHVSEPCDAAYLDYINRSLPWCPGLPEKALGSPWEQTFDAVQISRDRATAHFTRIGGGADRAIHLRPVAMRPGETLRLAPETLPAGVPVQWGCHDGDRAQTRPNPARAYDCFVDYFDTVAGVSPDGAVTARKPGDAVVLAMVPGGEKELFAIEVR